MLDVVHAHDEATHIAAERGLSPTESRELIRQRQIENHERAKQRVVEGLWESVTPREQREYLQEREYFDGVRERVSVEFSTEADELDDSNLEQEYAEVLRIESIRDPVKRDVEKRRYVRLLAERLDCRPEHAEAIYQRLASRLDDYRQLQKQRQALVLLDHEPQKYDQFIQLTRAGDDAGIDRLFASVEAPEIRERLQTLRANELQITEVIELREAELKEAARREFETTIDGFASMPADRQLLLGSIAESASDDFLAVMRASGLRESGTGFAGTFLRRPLVIDETRRGFLGAASIPTFDACGLQHAAAVDLTDRESFHVFDEFVPHKTAAFLRPFLTATREDSIPTTSELHRTAGILDLLGLRESAADGWMTLREFELLDSTGGPNRAGIDRLLRQLTELSALTQSFDGVSTGMLRRVLTFWQSEGETPQNSTILSAAEVAGLEP